ncbi:hypothetical protein OQA88_7118 [Cercophora sp. LCS_1]
MASPKWSLTEHLLSKFQDDFVKATQHPFLLAAAEGRLPKDALGRWLSNDRLYIHSYIRAAGKLLANIDLPQAVPGLESSETQLVDWLIEALAAIRKEERLFIEVANRYDLDIELGTQSEACAVGARIPDDAKLPGLVMIEGIFAGAGQSQSDSDLAAAGLPPTAPLPWLEGAVTFWGTERCYLDAWSWAKSKQSPSGWFNPKKDADGGALRNEFIPNWSSAGFSRFVGRLGSLIDFAINDQLEKAGGGAEELKQSFLDRIEGQWMSLLAAEAAFWPDV